MTTEIVNTETGEIVEGQGPEIPGLETLGIVTSPKLDKLFEAVATAQSQMEFAEKGAKAGNERKSWTYADIASVIAAGAPLAKNGVAVMQPTVSGKRRPNVVTILGHKSGQFLAFALEGSDRPHDDGAAITYTRRYALQGAVSIPAKDDDGVAQQTAATNSPPPSKGSNKPRPSGKPPAKTRRQPPAAQPNKASASAPGTIEHLREWLDLQLKARHVPAKKIAEAAGVSLTAVFAAVNHKPIGEGDAKKLHTLISNDTDEGATA